MTFSDRLVVDDEVRESFRSQLSSNMPHVLAYLNNMDTAGDANVALLVRPHTFHVHQANASSRSARAYR